MACVSMETKIQSELQDQEEVAKREGKPHNQIIWRSLLERGRIETSETSPQ